MVEISQNTVSPQKLFHISPFTIHHNHSVRNTLIPNLILATPIYLSSTYKLDSAEHGAALCENQHILGHSPYLYTRWGNPTLDVVGAQITALEDGFATLLTSSGMSAIATALFSVLKSGDHVVAPR